ncbi:MAG: NAD(P)-binding domain-containing protein, partial [Anaerolineae bacterium]|nr:NAD(P)-binding domain-containing protein [Anaerolineae bacterium]
MQLGMVGLGKMGANMSKRLIDGGHELVVTDLNPASIAAVERAVGVNSAAELVQKLTSPRAIWVMIPAGSPTETTLFELAEYLAPGDILIDGGNSNY